MFPRAVVKRMVTGCAKIESNGKYTPTIMKLWLSVPPSTKFGMPITMDIRVVN
jgi:hypothetical protein